MTQENVSFEQAAETLKVNLADIIELFKQGVIDATEEDGAWYITQDDLKNAALALGVEFEGKKFSEAEPSASADLLADELSSGPADDMRTVVGASEARDPVEIDLSGNSNVFGPSDQTPASDSQQAGQSDVFTDEFGPDASKKRAETSDSQTAPPPESQGDSQVLGDELDRDSGPGSSDLQTVVGNIHEIQGKSDEEQVMLSGHSSSNIMSQNVLDEQMRDLATDDTGVEQAGDEEDSVHIEANTQKSGESNVFDEQVPPGESETAIGPTDDEDEEVAVQTDYGPPPEAEQDQNLMEEMEQRAAKLEAQQAEEQSDADDAGDEDVDLVTGSFADSSDSARTTIGTPGASSEERISLEAPEEPELGDAPPPSASVLEGIFGPGKSPSQSRDPATDETALNSGQEGVSEASIELDPGGDARMDSEMSINLDGDSASAGAPPESLTSDAPEDSQTLDVDGKGDDESGEDSVDIGLGEGDEGSGIDNQVLGDELDGANLSNSELQTVVGSIHQLQGTGDQVIIDGGSSINIPASLLSDEFKQIAQGNMSTAVGSADAEGPVEIDMEDASGPGESQPPEEEPGQHEIDLQSTDAEAGEVETPEEEYVDEEPVPIATDRSGPIEMPPGSAEDTVTLDDEGNVAGQPAESLDEPAPPQPAERDAFSGLGADLSDDEDDDIVLDPTGHEMVDSELSINLGDGDTFTHGGGGEKGPLANMASSESAPPAEEFATPTQPAVPAEPAATEPADAAAEETAGEPEAAADATEPPEPEAAAEPAGEETSSSGDSQIFGDELDRPAGIEMQTVVGNVHELDHSDQVMLEGGASSINIPGDMLSEELEEVKRVAREAQAAREAEASDASDAAEETQGDEDSDVDLFTDSTTPDAARTAIGIGDADSQEVALSTGDSADGVDIPEEAEAAEDSGSSMTLDLDRAAEESEGSIDLEAGDGIVSQGFASFESQQKAEPVEEASSLNVDDADAQVLGDELEGGLENESGTVIGSLDDEEVHTEVVQPEAGDEGVLDELTSGTEGDMPTAIVSTSDLGKSDPEIQVQWQKEEDAEVLGDELRRDSGPTASDVHTVVGSSEDLGLTDQVTVDGGSSISGSVFDDEFAEGPGDSGTAITQRADEEASGYVQVEVAGASSEETPAEETTGEVDRIDDAELAAADEPAAADDAAPESAAEVSAAEQPMEVEPASEAAGETVDEDASEPVGEAPASDEPTGDQADDEIAARAFRSAATEAFTGDSGRDLKARLRALQSEPDEPAIDAEPQPEEAAVPQEAAAAYAETEPEAAADAPAEYDTPEETTPVEEAGSQPAEATDWSQPGEDGMEAFGAAADEAESSAEAETAEPAESEPADAGPSEPEPSSWSQNTYSAVPTRDTPSDPDMSINLDDASQGGKVPLYKQAPSWDAPAEDSLSSMVGPSLADQASGDVVPGEPDSQAADEAAGYDETQPPAESADESPATEADAYSPEEAGQDQDAAGYDQPSQTAFGEASGEPDAGYGEPGAPEHYEEHYEQPQDAAAAQWSEQPLAEETPPAEGQQDPYADQQPWGSQPQQDYAAEAPQQQEAWGGEQQPEYAAEPPQPEAPQGWENPATSWPEPQAPAADAYQPDAYQPDAYQEQQQPGYGEAGYEPPQPEWGSPAAGEFQTGAAEAPTQPPAEQTPLEPAIYQENNLGQAAGQMEPPVAEEPPQPEVAPPQESPQPAAEPAAVPEVRFGFGSVLSLAVCVMFLVLPGMLLAQHVTQVYLGDAWVVSTDANEKIVDFVISLVHSPRG